MTSSETIVSVGKDGERRKPIPIITTEDGKITFQRENLTRLLSHKILKDTPIAVVSIAGKKRLGKSLFLNLLLCYLKNRGWEVETQDWLSRWDSSVHDGFVSRGGDEPVTSGIIAWGEPIFVRCPSTNKEIAIILLDTEGTFDTKNRNISVGIFALSTLFSSLQIFNLDKQITLDDLDYLKYFTKQARVVAQQERMTDVDRGRTVLVSRSRFQHLVFLIRNWSNSDRSFGNEGGREYMQQELGNFVRSDVQIDDIEGRHPIYGAFQNISCFLMPEPEKNVRFRGKSGPALTVRDIGKEFLDYISIFAEEYLHPDKVPTKPMRAEYLLGFLEQCAKRIEEGYLPELKDIDQLMAQDVIQKATMEAVTSFLSKMEEFINNTEQRDWKKFDDAVKSQKENSSNNFRHKVQIYVSAVDLDAEVKRLRQTLDEKTRSSLIKKMQIQLIPDEKKAVIDHFTAVVKREMEEMTEVTWAKFDETIVRETTQAVEKFMQNVLHPDTNLNLEDDKSDLKNKLAVRAEDNLKTIMRRRRKEYIKNESEKLLEKAKEQLEEYSDSTFFPLVSGIKQIKEQCVDDFESHVELDERDSSVVKDMTKKFESHAAKAETSAHTKIGLRYAGAAVGATGAAVATFFALPFALPVCLVAAGACAVSSFPASMLGSKMLAFIGKKSPKEKND